MHLQIRKAISQKKGDVDDNFGYVLGRSARDS